MNNIKIINKDADIDNHKVYDILILLSTYNGEKYILEQLESIKNQRGVTPFCLIRDDGSTDSTKQIIKEYCDMHENFQYMFGENVGVVKSFSQLIKNPLVEQYQWIAFSDQDDVWEEKKLFRAISILDKETKKHLPLLYCSNLELVDQNLIHIGYMHNKDPRSNEYSACVQNCATGCTQVFNQIAAQTYVQGDTSKIEMHDYWMFLISLYFGIVMYDYRTYIKYRQHSDNVVGAKRKTIRKFLKNILYCENSKRITMLNCFQQTYADKMSNSQKSIIGRVVNSQNSLIDRINLLFHPLYRADSVKETLGFKVRLLINRLY